MWKSASNLFRSFVKKNFLQNIKLATFYSNMFKD